MLDFRLQVFYQVAKNLNFTQAAKELYISQPAVSKHIKELEGQYKSTLFERNGNRKMWLTDAGKLLLGYVEEVRQLDEAFTYELNLLSHIHAGVLRIGASSTVAQYVLAPILAKFHQQFKDVHIQLLTGNTAKVEQALLAKELDFALVEGISKNSQLKYETFIQDEIVLIAASTNKSIKKTTIKAEELKQYPLLLREAGSGTLEVISHALQQASIAISDLEIAMRLGSTESIKSYIAHSDCLAFVSKQSILKELRYKELQIIEIKDMPLQRNFYHIQRHGQLTALAELLTRFIWKQTR